MPRTCANTASDTSGICEFVLDTAAVGKDEKDEGMGVKHTTSVDSLLNRVFRLVVFKVLEEVAQKLALDARDVHVRFAVVSPSPPR